MSAPKRDARTWPRIPLSSEERVALKTLRLLIASGLIDGLYPLRRRA